MYDKINPAGCGCAAGNGPLAGEGGAQYAWRTRGRLGAVEQPAGQVYRKEYVAAPLAPVSQLPAPPMMRAVQTPATQSSYAQDVRCAQMQAAVAAAGCGVRPAGEIDPAGQVFYGGGYGSGWGYGGFRPVWNVTYPTYPMYPTYPSELLDDCVRWRTLTTNQKYQLASQTVPPWQVPLVVARLDMACGQPYQYQIYPLVLNYSWAFPRYGSWHRRRFGSGDGDSSPPPSPPPAPPPAPPPPAPEPPAGYAYGFVAPAG